AGRHPVVGHRRGVGEPRVHDGQLGPGELTLDDPLGVRVEVVARLQVGGDQQDEVGVGVVRAGPVVSLPDGVAEAGAGRADVGVAVVPVHAPRLQDALDVALVAGPADVV